MAKKEILKPFDLEKAKAGAKVVTKRGRDVRILCYDMRTEHYPIVAILNNDGNECARVYTKTGKAVIGEENIDDLQIVEEVEVPDRWRDRKDATLYGYYINEESCLVSDDCRGGYANERDNHNVFATEKQAQSALAMAQISQIMANDERFGGVVTTEEYKHSLTMPAIVRGIDDIDREPLIYLTVINTDGYWQPLLFHTLKQADLFLEENMDLVKQYFML